MPRDIVDRLLQDTVERGLHHGVQPPVIDRQAQIEPQVQSLAPGLDKVANGGFQAQIVQRRWPDFPRQPVDFEADPIGKPFERHKPLLQFVAFGQGVAEFIESKLKECEGLSEAVVQFAGDPLALGFLILHRRSQHLRKLRLHQRPPLSLFLEFGRNGLPLFKPPVQLRGKRGLLDFALLHARGRPDRCAVK